MNNLQDEFNKSANNIEKININNHSSEILLEIYSLYKQSTVGNCNIDKPWFYDQKGIAKWNAWNEKKGKDQEECMLLYIKKVNELISNNN